MTKRIEEPFINKFGHKIEVGDKVVVVAQGYSHCVRTYIGTYIGYTIADYYGRQVQHTQIKTLDTGSRWNPKLAKPRIATLQNNLIFPAPKE